MQRETKNIPKYMKTNTIMRILLMVAIIVMGYFCVMSVVTPIRFEEKRAQREVAVIKHLVALRTAETEFKAQKGHYTADLDSLIDFLRTAPKKEVLKEGRLNEKQLEAGLNEHKAVKIMDTAKAKAKKKQQFANDDELYAYIWANDPEVKKNGLEGFRRDTILTNLIESVYKGEYNAANIGDIIYIPFTNKVRFEAEVNNTYTTGQGIHVPLVEMRAHYNTYLADLNNQERVNLIDKEEKLDHYPGLKFGDIETPNNNAGNWE